MKKFLLLFFKDFKEFIKNNYKILISCFVTVCTIQYFGKGNSIVNLSVIFLHIIGDIMMIISLTKYAQEQKKSACVYMASSSIFFITVGLVAVIQSDEGKNWQYFLGTTPFLVANLYQIFDAWDIRGKDVFNYKTTFLTTLIIGGIYYKMDLVYIHAWIQIIGFSLFPIFLGMHDSPKVFLGRIFSVFIMLVGVLIDIKFQIGNHAIIPATALSSFFITLIAFFGFINNANMYIKKVKQNDFFTLKILKFLILTQKAT